MSTNTKTNGVAVICAGLGGTAVTLALHSQSIPCRTLEAKTADSDILSSGVSITPNGCRILDELGILSRVEDKSYICEYTANKDADDKTLRKMRIASDAYPCYRLYRLALLKEMKATLAERKVPVFYGMKLENIISDTTEGVVFQACDRTESAAMVIGYDGIHSTLRRHITDLVPVHANLLCVYGHISTESVQWPDQNFAAGYLMVGMQFMYPEADRKGWESLASDPSSLVALLRKDYGQWHDTAKHAIEKLCKRPEGTLCWPFYAMPKLSSWSSSSGNVIMIGDAAHAIPASSGQGVNLALEDVF
ncbi:hypothetical protein FVER53590_25981 [Fusarium verticillioides]|nr:hypothetical protein FVER53590_25981 [Fusarium verticillioides]